jgi:hypothetical protein
MATRATLFNGLHEIGHCVNDEKNLRSYQREEATEQFARSTFKEFGLPLPRMRIALGVSYVRRKKRHGDNIILGQ